MTIDSMLFITYIAFQQFLRQLQEVNLAECKFILICQASGKINFLSVSIKVNKVRFQSGYLSKGSQERLREDKLHTQLSLS